jgi:hypothetical protein
MPTKRTFTYAAFTARQGYGASAHQTAVWKPCFECVIAIKLITLGLARGDFEWRLCKQRRCQITPKTASHAVILAVHRVIPIAKTLIAIIFKHFHIANMLAPIRPF